jgi:hypothetical protein
MTAESAAARRFRFGACPPAPGDQSQAADAEPAGRMRYARPAQVRIIAPRHHARSKKGHSHVRKYRSAYRWSSRPLP